MVTICTTSITFNNCTFCPHCIYVFCIYLRTNSDLCHLQHKLIGFYNRDLTLYSPVVTICTTSITFNNCTLCPHCIFVFCIYLRTNSSLGHLQPKLIDFYNRAEKCLKRGTDRIILCSAHTAVSMCFLRISEQTAIISLYDIKWT